MFTSQFQCFLGKAHYVASKKGIINCKAIFRGFQQCEEGVKLNKFLSGSSGSEKTG